MKSTFTNKIFIFLVMLSFLLSCKKENTSQNKCFENDITIQQIINKEGIIKLVGETFYIIEVGSIDGRFRPCNLEEAFQVNNLEVNFSGEVKATISNPMEPCCTNNFVISEISK